MKCSNCNNSLVKKMEFSYDFLLKKKFNVPHSLLVCNYCEIGITVPILNKKSILDYYKSEYLTSLKNNFFINYLQKIKFWRDYSQIKKLSRNQLINILDLGSGEGRFVNYVQNRGSFITGIEFDIDAIESAKIKYNLNLQLGSFDDLAFTSKYEIVIMRHTLEHSLNSLELLRNIYENALTLEGILILKIPNFTSIEAKIFKQFWHGYDIPRHRIHFSKKSITHVLNKCEFKNIKIINEFVPLDFYRSLQNYSLFHNKRLFNFLDYPFSKNLFLIILTPIIFVISIFGRSRLVVYAKK